MPHFGAAIRFFSVRFCAALYCFNFAWISTAYVRPLSHLSVQGFVTFAFFTLRGHLFLTLHFHLFFFINTCAFSYYLSLLLPDEACGRYIVNSTACCSLNYVNTFRPRWMLELLLCCALRCCHSRLFCTFRCCVLLLQLFLHFYRLSSSAFSSFSTGFCHFRIFHTSLSPFCHTSLSPFFPH